MVGLSPEEYRKKYPKELSGGQQQRVGLARAMAGDPSIMLMDEPFGAIDSIIRSNLQDELLRIQKLLNKTVLFVTHDINEALKLGDQVIVMNDGEIQQFDTPENIILKPENDFVSSLINSNDLFQRFSFLKASNFITKPNFMPDERAPRINENDNLKEALSKILKSKFEYVSVESEFGNIIGTIGINEFKEYQKTL